MINEPAKQNTTHQAKKSDIQHAEQADNWVDKMTAFYNGQFVRVREGATLDGTPHPCAGLKAVVRISYGDHCQIRLAKPHESRIALWMVDNEQIVSIDNA